MSLFMCIMRLYKQLYSSFSCFVSQMQKGCIIYMALGGFITLPEAPLDLPGLVSLLYSWTSSLSCPHQHTSLALSFLL